MRIVDVCAFYTPSGGGVRTYIAQKLALAEAMGVDMTVVAPGEADGTQAYGALARIETLRSPRLPVDRKYGYFADQAAIHAALDRLAPDLVEVSSPWRSPVMVATWRPDVPKALVMHADPLAAYAYRWLGPIMARERIDRRFDGYWRHLRRLGRTFDAVVCANADLSA
ncbi:MAG: glycosyltransferase, partial [Tsuneonella sp.]